MKIQFCCGQIQLCSFCLTFNIAATMGINLRQIIFWSALVLCLSQASAFWWSRSDPPAEPQNQWPVPSMPVYYQQRLLKTHSVQPNQMQFQHQHQPQQQYQENQQIPVPAIPIQMPLQAHLAHVPNVHNVQLVPCLCPISPEIEYEKPTENVHTQNNIKNTV